MSERGISVEDRLDAIYRLVAVVFLAVGTVHSAGALRDLLEAGSLIFTIATQVRTALILIIPLLCVWVVWRAVSLKPGRGAAPVSRPVASSAMPFCGLQSSRGS